MAETINFIGCLCAFIFLNHKHAGYWRYIIPFLFFTFLLEIAADILVYYHHYNSWLYNIYLLIDFIFTGWLLRCLWMKHALNRWLTISALMIFFTVYLCESSFTGFIEYNNVSDATASFFIIIGCNWFYYLLLKEDSWVDIMTYAPFWLVTGIFLFNFCSTVSALFSNQLLDLYVSESVSLRYVLFEGFNIILFSCWIYSFICKYRERMSLP